jgi:hypothetical protein
MAHLTGGMAYPQPTSVVIAMSSAIPAKLALGTRARDAQGNEYIYLDFDATKAVGELVTWDSAFLATDTGATTVGPIGVVCGESATSDVAGWVQIYGQCSFVLGTTALTSGWLKVVATTDGYSVPGQASASSGDTYKISGMYATAAPTTATSPGYASTASSILGLLTCILNYPFVMADISSS